MNAEAEHNAPPPPYTPTDLLSNAGTTSNLHLTPTPSRTDAASVVAASSTNNSIIYTPLSSPPGSVSHEQRQENSFSHYSSSSATAFFESRPAPSNHATSSQPIIHSLNVTSNTRPSDLPYPSEWGAKDVSQQDWATFVNFLLPDHASGVNEAIVDRKLQAEFLDERMDGLNLGPEDKSRSDQVSAQLESLRHPKSPTIGNNAIAATVAEWNDNFFQPRGIWISTSDSAPVSANIEEKPRMPGEWIPYDHELLPEPSTTQSGGRNNGPGRRGMFSGLTFPGMDASSRGFRFGPIVADSEGFRIGKNGLVADNTGFRMGNMLIADQKGFRLGGARGFVADSHGVTMGGRSFGRRESGDIPQERGRGRGPRVTTRSEGPQKRSESVSSSSSSSSSSSESSIGSLPDYDDLKDQQLPIAQQSLKEWLTHPEQPITKEGIRNLKQDLKDAKKNPHTQSGQEVKALRQEVKQLLKAFRESKRAQKKHRRAARRARHSERRALKRERRSAKRAERRCRKEGKQPARDPQGDLPPWSTTGPKFASQIPMQPPILDIPGTNRAFPFARSGSAPCAPGPQVSPGPQIHAGTSPGVTAMHGGWPFTQGLPYAPGRISIPHPAEPSPVSRGSEEIHAQAREMAKKADKKEAEAVEIHIAMTLPDVKEKERLKMMDDATALEEEAENCRREADRLTAEAMHLDSELARELEETGQPGQISGIISH
ncbi:hypothetical protein BGZ60DRAFT_523258 [Tricladium varicosporioides]|nr:hypothetical protein BGZ60DRAFT_523258 [Hymenoscyphus varicosporioides]